MLYLVKKYKKRDRQDILIKKVTAEPFLTDEDLAMFFGVSVPTIRLDRLELAIPELRERIKNVAEERYDNIRTLSSNEIVGEIIDFNLGETAISILEVDQSMAFEKTNIIRGHYIYSLAESLAIAIIDAHVALVGVANIKYKVPVHIGDKLVAKAELKSLKDEKNIVWVKIYIKSKEVFRGKFILVSIDD